MLGVPVYTYERRPYSATLYPISFTLDSLLSLTISAQRKIYGLCFTPGPMACVGEFSCDYMFGKIREEDFNRWADMWTQQPLEQY